MSHPSRVCGLKSSMANLFKQSEAVTPLAGVWIEILKCVGAAVGITVTPLAGVWIEITGTVSPAVSTDVTPLAGVWIEIPLYPTLVIRVIVTPLAGVWIEIVRRLMRQSRSGSHTPRGCVD